MTKTKIFSIVFAVTSLILTYVLYRSINDSIQETKRIERMEKAIIDQLMMIREAQVAYKTVNGSYTSDWDKLLNFVDSGSFFIIEKTETIIPLAYGADSTIIKVDTIGKVLFKDSIYTAARYPRFNIETLPFVPEVEPATKFNLWADKITKSGVLVDVVEVWDPKPSNPKRSEESEFNTKKPLRFGSRTNVTVAGNWE